MAETTPPFDKTEALAHELALKHGLTWREQVHLEAAMNALFMDLGFDKAMMPVYVNSMRRFVSDVLENVYEN